jgi:hypothetical protein
MGPGGIWLRPPRCDVDADLGREFFEVALSCACAWAGGRPGIPFALASASSVLLTGLPARPPWPASSRINSHSCKHYNEYPSSHTTMLPNFTIQIERQ